MSNSIARGNPMDRKNVSLEKNKLLVRQYTEKIVNTGKIDEIDEYISPEYYGGNRPDRKVVGIEGAKQHILGVRQTYPDLHLTVEQQIAEGEWFITCIKAWGSHQGSWLGIKPTEKKVEITGVNIDRVIGDRIVEHGGATNLLEAFLEIGAIKVVS
jgi:predicted ester cyclase